VSSAQVTSLLEHARERAMCGRVLGQQLDDRGVGAARLGAIAKLAVEIAEQTDDHEVVRVDRAPLLSGHDRTLELVCSLKSSDVREPSRTILGLARDGRCERVEITRLIRLAAGWLGRHRSQREVIASVRASPRASHHQHTGHRKCSSKIHGDLKCSRGATVKLNKFK
jgi:hypothetical protein